MKEKGNKVVFDFLAELAKSNNSNTNESDIQREISSANGRFPTGGKSEPKILRTVYPEGFSNEAENEFSAINNDNAKNNLNPANGNIPNGISQSIPFPNTGNLYSNRDNQQHVGNGIIPDNPQDDSETLTPAAFDERIKLLLQGIKATSNPAMPSSTPSHNPIQPVEQSPIPISVPVPVPPIEPVKIVEEMRMEVEKTYPMQPVEAVKTSAFDERVKILQQEINASIKSSPLPFANMGSSNRGSNLSTNSEENTHTNIEMNMGIHSTPQVEPNEIIRPATCYERIEFLPDEAKDTIQAPISETKKIEMDNDLPISMPASDEQIPPTGTLGNGIIPNIQVAPTETKAPSFYERIKFLQEGLKSTVMPSAKSNANRQTNNDIIPPTIHEVEKKEIVPEQEEKPIDIPVNAPVASTPVISEAEYQERIKFLQDQIKANPNTPKPPMGSENVAQIITPNSNSNLDNRMANSNPIDEIKNEIVPIVAPIPANTISVSEFNERIKLLQDQINANAALSKIPVTNIPDESTSAVPLVQENSKIESALPEAEPEEPILPKEVLTKAEFFESIKHLQEEIKALTSSPVHPPIETEFKHAPSDSKDVEKEKAVTPIAIEKAVTPITIEKADLDEDNSENLSPEEYYKKIKLLHDQISANLTQKDLIIPNTISKVEDTISADNKPEEINIKYKNIEEIENEIVPQPIPQTDKLTPAEFYEKIKLLHEEIKSNAIITPSETKEIKNEDPEFSNSYFEEIKASLIKSKEIGKEINVSVAKNPIENLSPKELFDKVNNKVKKTKVVVEKNNTQKESPIIVVDVEKGITNIYSAKDIEGNIAAGNKGGNKKKVSNENLAVTLEEVSPIEFYGKVKYLNKDLRVKSQSSPSPIIVVDVEKGVSNMYNSDTEYNNGLTDSDHEDAEVFLEANTVTTKSLSPEEIYEKVKNINQEIKITAKPSVTPLLVVDVEKGAGQMFSSETHVPGAMSNQVIGNVPITANAMTQAEFNEQLNLINRAKLANTLLSGQTAHVQSDQTHTNIVQPAHEEKNIVQERPAEVKKEGLTDSQKLAAENLSPAEFYERIKQLSKDKKAQTGSNASEQPKAENVNTVAAPSTVNIPEPVRNEPTRVEEVRSDNLPHATNQEMNSIAVLEEKIRQLQESLKTNNVPPLSKFIGSDLEREVLNTSKMRFEEMNERLLKTEDLLNKVLEMNQNQIQNPNIAAPPPKQSRFKSVLAKLNIVIILLVVLFIGYTWYQSKNKKNTEKLPIQNSEMANTSDSTDAGTTESDTSDMATLNNLNASNTDGNSAENATPAGSTDAQVDNQNANSTVPEQNSGNTETPQNEISTNRENPANEDGRKPSVASSPKQRNTEKSSRAKNVVEAPVRKNTSRANNTPVVSNKNRATETKTATTVIAPKTNVKPNKAPVVAKEVSFGED